MRRTATRRADRRGGVRSFSEDAFHRWLATALRRGGGGLLPMGDDVAAIRWGGQTLLLTTDALGEGTHFTARSPPEWVGRAAVAASFSDIASKGGRPIAVLLDLLLPSTTPEGWAQAVVRGAEAFASRHGCHVVGGDTKAAPARSVVGTVAGVTSRLRLPRRDGARAGDLLIATGTVGRGGVRSRALLGRRRPTRRELVDALRIEPRLAEGEALAPIAHALIDTSDGMGDAARRLAEASRIRLVLDDARIPWDPGLAPIAGSAVRRRWAFYGGDYELLAAVPADRAAEAVRAVRRRGGRAGIVGDVRPGHGAFLNVDGDLRPMPRPGWNPFRRSAPAGPVLR